jgi:hypothetical protein
LNNNGHLEVHAKLFEEVQAIFYLAHNWNRRKDENGEVVLLRLVDERSNENIQIVGRRENRSCLNRKITLIGKSQTRNQEHQY